MQSEMILPAETALAVPLPLACALMAVFGAVIGSFLNVVIHRVPREQSIVFPNSTCPKCRAPIRAYDNIPILSYLVLRGQRRAHDFAKCHYVSRYSIRFDEPHRGSLPDGSVSL